MSASSQPPQAESWHDLFRAVISLAPFPPELHPVDDGGVFFLG